MAGDPLNDERFYVACREGLVRIENAFTRTMTFTHLSGSHGLPRGGISAAPYVAPDGQTIIVGVGQSGIYKTSDGGSSWLKVGGEKDFSKLFDNR